MTAATWWKTATIYQIYPRSFQDSDGDGVGDLAGVRARLDHLVDLGVDALWLSPIFVSPMRDFGYDIADYTAIDQVFGTMEDFDALIAEVHRRGLKMILDLVPNHTSDEHAWFRDSRAGRDSPKRDWYIWRDPAPDGGPPNNWQSEFGGSAWAFDEATGQYYYHAFLASQPDLNWRNPAVREAVTDVMRFWLDKGVDGFRIDVLWHLMKDQSFRDNPENPRWRNGDAPTDRLIKLYTTDLPEMEEVVRLLRQTVEPYGDRVLIGEIYLPTERLVRYYGADDDGVHLPFNFALIDAPWDARHIDQMIHDYERALPEGGWPNWVTGNHDKPRLATRVGLAQARVAAVLLLTLRGTPTLYYGEEIGMEHAVFDDATALDPFARQVPGFGLGRDGARTPMQWRPGPNAGFSDGTPWLPVSRTDEAATVEGQRDDPASMLSLYRRLLALRRTRAAFTEGVYQGLAAEGDLLLYLREAGAERFLVALNLGSTPISVRLTGPAAAGEVVISARPGREGERVGGELHLDGDNALVIALDPT
ncbi:alpha-amylase family glycosyl hydrolase [Chthonobacter rhizosphaerae]|uniref:alpha-amylase family glycosyl hydrolase n=1 Tax=Chthonobacter rhizosphaerae TaxID=2735553 RepID=UPI0015EE473C|nr:alpha-amylase family glycosyl hydrolase [Chthonobacter rhizosphaerae]